MNLGILHALSNRPASAFLEFREAATTYELIGNLRGRALVLSNMAWLRHAILGEDSAAEEDARSALLAYQQMEDKRGQAQCLGTLGSIMCRRGACAESADAFGRALSLAREARDSWIEAQVLMEWARCCLETGRFAEGLARADEALKRSSQLGMGTLAISLHALRGRLLLELNRSDEALDATGTAVAERQPSVGTRQSVAYAHSLALAATGHQKQAEQYLGIAFQDLMTAVSDLPEGEQRAALTSVPDHRAIVQAWSSRQPKHESHILARVEAPMGRPLPPDERIAVVWTVDSPDDVEIQSTIHRRRHRLLRLLAEARNQGGSPTVPELAQALHTSVATIRRDLAILRRSGLEARTRGSRFPTLLRTARPGQETPEP